MNEMTDDTHTTCRQEYLARGLESNPVKVEFHETQCQTERQSLVLQKTTVAPMV